MTEFEKWASLPGYPSYRVSSIGRVWSVKRGSLLKTPIGTNGRRKFSAYREGRRFNVEVHVAVCTAFAGPRPAGYVVRHLNGDELDNRTANLRYGTPSENSQDTITHGSNYWLSRTHCPYGHEYSEDNLVLQGRFKQRKCKTCHRLRAAERRRKSREASH